MSRASLAPGQRSLQGLGWLARVGASPLEPWGLVMGWRRTVTYDHARRLAAAGLVRMVRMTRGDGSLVVLTAAGAARAGYPASWAPQVGGAEHMGARQRVRVGERLAAAARASLVERARDPRGRVLATRRALPRPPRHRARHAPPRSRVADRRTPRRDRGRASAQDPRTPDRDLEHVRRAQRRRRCAAVRRALRLRPRRRRRRRQARRRRRRPARAGAELPHAARRRRADARRGSRRASASRDAVGASR